MPKQPVTTCYNLLQSVSPVKPQGGFTLIELLVTITLMLLLTGMTIPVFTVFSRRQDLSQAVKQVKVVLRDAQNRASSGVKEGTCPGATCRGDWGVDFSAPAGGPYTYRLFAVDLQSSINYFANKLDKPPYTLPSSVMMALSPVDGNRACVVFSSVSGQVGLYRCGGTDILNPPSPMDFPLTITLDGEGGPRSVIVEANGRIWEQ